jgi:hypothetical protein
MKEQNSEIDVQNNIINTLDESIWDTFVDLINLEKRYEYDYS